MSQVPNILSLVRMLFVPLILWLILSNYFLLSAVVVALVGLTDYLDGYIARRYNHAVSYTHLTLPTTTSV